MPGNTYGRNPGRLQETERLFKWLVGIFLLDFRKTLDLELTPGGILFLEVHYENCGSK